jgi:hypothetical protein
MRKRCYRYYGGLLSAQESWLNSMASRGWRLVRAEKMLYEFENCAPGQYQYCVEFIGRASREKAEDYRVFLEDMGYKVFFKNINLNYSVGKLRWRPWAGRGGRIATNSTTFNRELLIVEKLNDGSTFELHTSNEDLAAYYSDLRAPWLFLFLFTAALAVIKRVPAMGMLSLLALIPTVLYQLKLTRARRQGKTEE